MIKEDVVSQHVAYFPQEMPLLKKIETDFDVTWGRRLRKFNTELSAYFLKPLKHISQTFGFDQELVVFVSAYESLQARAIQATEEFFRESPAKGRVDQTVAMFISNSRNVENWLQNYTAQNPQDRAYVGIYSEDLLSNKDAWFIRNRLFNQLFSRDLFDYTLPLDKDLFFFGRSAIVAEHIDAIRKGENRGLFGLRKIGKTSLLFKIQRQCQENGIYVRYYDCKLPAIYKQSGEQFILRVCKDIEDTFSISIRTKLKQDPSEYFLRIVEKIPTDKKFCLMFDEVEYISPKSRLAPHWQTDFIPFWQSLWSVQSQIRKFSFIVSGVNASLVETDRFNGIQNPVFGIIRSHYLTGFERNELFSLLSVFGKRMGLRFDEGATNALYERYGGHPLLTRIVCSQVNAGFKSRNQQRPVDINQDTIRHDIDHREEEIKFYCGHIVSELEEFHPAEYEMLEMLAVGNKIDFVELASDIDLVRHLNSYGLIDLSAPTNPAFKIPVIKKFISDKCRKKNGSRVPQYLVPVERREEYVVARISSIIRDFRASERKFLSLELPSLFGGSGPFEAELLSRLPVAGDRDGMILFLNQAYRSLIEPIDQQGRKTRKAAYFYEDIKVGYPVLWDSLNRIRAYRNYFLHLELTTRAEAHLEAYLRTDLDGIRPEASTDGFFRVQSAILDNLLLSIHAQLKIYD